MITLILGGARSGKSRLAERLASTSGHAVTYIATATAGDDEMKARIAHHRAGRPSHWTTIEEPFALGKALGDGANVGRTEPRTILVDCLTLWLSNLLHEPARFASERAALLAALPAAKADILLVSNETGLGIVPMNELSRQFIDEAGRLHQDLAQVCNRVIFVVAGLPHVLKGEPL